MRIALMLIGLMIGAFGCYQMGSDGDGDLRAVPVTNNPNLLPERDMSPIQSMPY